MRDPYGDVKKALKEQKSLVYWDLETAPMSVYIWRLGEQVVNHEQIISESKIITIQWMFEGWPVQHLTWDKDHDDRSMLERFSRMMQDVKVAVSQNGKEFDHKVLRWRLNVLGLTPLKSVEIIDTLHLSRANFAAPSHSLDYRSRVYGLGGKVKMHFQDWIDVIERKPGALNKMITYGCKDVEDLRSIFWRELPFLTELPISLAVLINPNDRKAREFCPRCAEARQSRFNVYPTKVQNKLMYKCGKCGLAWKESRVLVI